MNELIAAAVVVALASSASANALSQPSAQYDWKIEGVREGCQISTSKVSGKEYIAAKASCVVPSRLEVIGMVLRDIANFPRWMKDCEATKILRALNSESDAYLFWYHQHIPLFSDRDIVLRTATTIRPGHARIRAYSTNELGFNPGTEYVRMPSFTSEFTLDWIDREHTRVTFMIDPDLGDGLPRGIANSNIKEVPLQSLLGLARIARESNYVNAAKGSAYEQSVLAGIRNGTLK